MRARNITIYEREDGVLQRMIRAERADPDQVRPAGLVADDPEDVGEGDERARADVDPAAHGRTREGDEPSGDVGDVEIVAGLGPGRRVDG